MKELSIVLLNFNRVALTKKAVPRLLATTGVDFELIIVDNGSTDGTPRYLRSLKDKRIKLVLNKKNLYFGGGNNSAIPNCTGESVLFTQNDMFFERESIRRLLDFQRALSDAGCIGVGGGYVSKKAVISEISDWWREKIRVFDYMPVDFLSGCLMLLKRKLLTHHQIKFDTKYRLYWEDVDISHQIKSLGMPLYMINNALIGTDHIRSGTITPLLGVEKREQIRSESEAYYRSKWKKFLGIRSNFESEIKYQRLITGLKLNYPAADLFETSEKHRLDATQVAKGEFEEFTGNFRKAAGRYREVIRKNPDNFLAFRNLLRSLSHLDLEKNHDELVALLEECVSPALAKVLGPDVFQTIQSALLRVARRYADTSNFPEAIRFYDKLEQIARTPATKAVCQIETAKLRYLLKDYKRAEREMSAWLRTSKGLKLDPRMYVAAHFYLGEMARIRRDRATALSRYKIALSLDPTHDRARNRVEELESKDKRR